VFHSFEIFKGSCEIAGTLENLKGGPEPLEKQIHKFLGSKRRGDRFSNLFFEMVPKIYQGSFFVLILP